MTIRDEVTHLLRLGALPTVDADEHIIEAHDDALRAVRAPLSDEEAALLIKLFGPDDCYGLAWKLLHLIESAASGVPIDVEPAAGSERVGSAALATRAAMTSRCPKNLRPDLTSSSNPEKISRSDLTSEKRFLKTPR